MSIDALREHYQRVWRADATHDEEKGFITALLEEHGRERLDFHFELLRNREHFYFYCAIRAAFEEHGAVAEPYLVARFREESEPHLRGDALQILGHMRSKNARGLAREAVRDEAVTVRNRGVIVLGWVGTAADVRTVLTERLRHDPAVVVRGNAATAFRQIWYYNRGDRDEAIELLGEALKAEDDETVVCSIVVTLQDIMRRRFGLREVSGEPGFVGDPVAAKERALQLLNRQLPVLR